MQRLSTNLVLIVALALLDGPALAQQQFDGHWSIEAIPERGTCRRPHHYRAVIENGTVRNGGSGKFNTAGGLEPDGRIRGSVQGSKTRVDVTGRLSSRSGSGTWTSAGRLNCSGRWNAEKRS
ncbi:hypothetical protein [Microvirga massiliensis]|uniref:hypothetical protein n=1 Tax=Microvirga massiliensis TaxID=1033741 RepID=UPI00065FF91A|nr:hypothetical protein [Microvirga massiliensis]